MVVLRYIFCPNLPLGAHDVPSKYLSVKKYLLWSSGCSISPEYSASVPDKLLDYDVSGVERCCPEFMKSYRYVSLLMGDSNISTDM